MKKKDIIFIIVLLILIGISSILIYGRHSKGHYVSVSVDGDIIGEYSLKNNQEILIKGYENGSNLLCIKDEEAYLSKSNCPDHLCEKQGHISKTGQSIICLPNRVVITIIDKKQIITKKKTSDHSIDAIVN